MEQLRMIKQFSFGDTKLDYNDSLPLIRFVLNIFENLEFWG